MDRAGQLGEEKVSQLLIKFSVPAIVGMLVNALYNVVDRVFVGNSAGKPGLAGITIGFPVMLVMMALMMLVGLGANSLVSIRLGERKKEEAELILGNAFILLIGISFALTIFGLLLLNPMLQLFGASREVLPYARAYLGIILLGSVFQGVGFGMNNFIRGEGNPRVAMFTMLLGAALNFILDPIFIFGLDMGIRGSALATIIAQCASSIWVLHYFLSGKSILKIRKINLRLNKAIILKVFALGSAPFLLQMAASLVNVILNRSLGRYGGDVAISGMGIVSSMFTLFLMPIFGINQGVQPIIGFNYGARKFDRVKHALKLAIFAATLIVCTGFVVTQLLSHQIAVLYTDDREVVAFTARAMRIFLIFVPIIGFQIVSSNYFQAVGKPKHSAFLSLSRQLLLLIPAVVILPLFFGLNGVLYAGPLSDFGSSVLTGVLLYRELKHLDRSHAGVMQEKAG